MTTTLILILAIIASGMMFIKTEYYGPDELKYIFKPLTTVCIIVLAAISVPDSNVSIFYKQMIICGLFFSLWGDSFLMMPSDRFVPGLISFLIAHIFYIIAFSFDVPNCISVFYAIPFLLYAVLIFRYLSMGFGRLRIPVMVYITVIMVMVFLSMNRFIFIPTQNNFYAFIGALFFMISDTFLAIRKFKYETRVSNAILFLESTTAKETVRIKGEFRIGQFLIMSTYYTAQVFIALSVY